MPQSYFLADALGLGSRLSKELVPGAEPSPQTACMSKSQKRRRQCNSNEPINHCKETKSWSIKNIAKQSL
jgi:hypothetical protein